MRRIPSVNHVRVIAFEAQVRYDDDPWWFTLCVARRWSAVETATARAAGQVDQFGRRVTATRVVTVDHSASVDFRFAF
jgi:hypothetical protein